MLSFFTKGKDISFAIWLPEFSLKTYRGSWENQFKSLPEWWRVVWFLWLWVQTDAGKGIPAVLLVIPVVKQ